MSTSTTPTTLQNKRVLITGGTRGIGRAIALRFARDGARVAVLGRHADTSPMASEIMASGGAQGLSIKCDMTNDAQVQTAVDQVAKEFGGLDILINNATVLVLKRTETLSMSDYDLMANTNTRGTFAATKYALPYLRNNPEGAHILTLCPEPQLEERWFVKNMAYTMSKFSMGLMAFGLSAEHRDARVASNALWPFTTIATDGLDECGNQELQKCPRLPLIMADAAYCIVTQDPGLFTGRFCLDEVVLRENGVRDFTSYCARPGAGLMDVSRDHLVSRKQLDRLNELRREHGDPCVEDK
ncbi:hypothetical protein GGI07_005188 [Coemansia sp. Benny D115]|nr:hypothetical protein GGI07_005188 [Coemansia sp. Benny D115]